MFSKAIYIELVTNLTTEAFLAALRRFISRRGRPAEINTDNATNFVGAYKDLRRLFNSNIHDFASSEEIKWNFIPPSSPHFGGLWEAGIKYVKYHLRSIVGKTKLTFEELSAVLTQIEACLNSRPLCPLTDDPEDLTALTAGHFLIGMPLTAVPSQVGESGSSLKGKWQLVEQIKTDFWKRWSCVLDRLRFLPIKKMDQRTCIKFCVKNEIKSADAFRMLTVAYGEATLDRNNVYRWYKMFSEGREDVNDEEGAGRPSTSTTNEKINEVKKMILANRRITVKEVAEDLNISIGSCHSIFINDLGMRRVATKFVQKLLNCDQKQNRMNIANEMLDSVRDDPNLLQRVITGDEAWVYGYDVETKAQSSQWKLPHEPRPKKARQVRSNVKVLLTVFFDFRGVVHHEFLPQGRTVNKEYYLRVMHNLREAIPQKRPDL
ncbi:hypothetical protein LAZ67_10001150 [Cordylochernes scorpioides]|uniref:Integrase catalytic domain-containing protein n=1 Tax=Cordylochernes scorpioides TaxID=51811 RepID=A0ABY6KVL7_9ARAC|nr:hypothetical protein LAZ67_10001150 [Cordylochernes scorpioides]